MPLLHPRIWNRHLRPTAKFAFLPVALSWTDGEGRRIRVFYATRSDAERALAVLRAGFRPC